MRIVQAALFVLILPLILISADPPQLPYTFRVLELTAQFLDMAETKVSPTPPAGRKGKTLVIFWTSERGAVVSARALDGPSELQQAALAAILKWKFKPDSVNGQPVQVGSAVIVDFSHTPPAIQLPKPMTAAQISPDFEFKCWDGIVHQEPSSVDVCRRQLEAYSSDSRSTPLDRFTAHDQYGLVLMKYAHDSQKAGDQFSQAIGLAPQGFNSSDAEWAYVYWHRAVAEQQSGNNADAERDFGVAENSLREAEKAIGKEKMAAHYHDLLGIVVKQHVAMLEGENKHDEAKQVLANFAQ
jgi:hypothetical protein